MTLTFSRRALLRATGGATAWLFAHGCAARPDEAYEPWSFPDDGERLESQLIGAALLAASPHNTQPWWFRVTPAHVDVFRDPERTLGPMDPLDREAFIGLGCAVENVVVAARALGRAPRVALLPDPADPHHVARVALDPAAPAREPLFDAIARRHTHRGAYVEMAPPRGLETALRAQLDDAAVSLVFLGSDAAKAALRPALADATRAILADVDMSEASHAWYRHDADEIRAHRDGTTLDATGSAWLVRALGRAGGRPDADTAGEYWLAATEGRQATAAAYVVLSTTERDSRREQLEVGRAYQRLHLWATREGLAMQPLNQLLERRDREATLALPPVAAPALEAVIGEAQRGAQMMFRIGVPLDEAAPSPRRPRAWVERSS